VVADGLGDWATADPWINHKEDASRRRGVCFMGVEGAGLRVGM
jgi:hypothetical protein